MINQSKLKEWVDIYLDYIKQVGDENHVKDEEGYKFESVENFQKNFNLKDEDIASMLDSAIKNNNLVAGNMHWPRKMLLIFATYNPEETRQILKNLFAEDQKIIDRLNEASEKIEHLMAKRNDEMSENSNTFIGLRFLSILLSFYNPNLYNAIKPREWKVFCKFVNPDFRIAKHTPIGEQYDVISEHIEALRSYIINIPQIKAIKEELTRGLNFKDDEYRWMAQDVIYITAKVFAAKKSNEKPVLAEPVIEENDDEEVLTIGGMEFPLEKYLEHFIIKNWDNIDFGEKLELFIDEDGTSGEQYTTEVGIIDILARDKEKNFVVIELKRSMSGPEVIGQILGYMTWVQDNLATSDEKVRGIVIVADGKPALLSAQRQVSDKVKIKYYKVNLSLVNPE